MSFLTAQIGRGVAKGSSGALEYERGRKQRELQLEDAELMMKRKKQEQKEWEANSGTRSAESDQRLAQAEQAAYQARGELFRTQTYDSFRRFDSDNDVRHLNQMLKDSRNNPVAASLYQGVTRFDQPNEGNHQDFVRLLGLAGYENPTELADDADFKKNFFMLMDTNGEYNLVQKSQLYAATGYTKFMQREELAELQAQADLAAALRGPASAETQIIRDIAKEDGISLLEAAKEYRRKSQASSAVEREADRLQLDDPTLSRTEALQKASLAMSKGTKNEREAALRTEEILADNPNMSREDAYAQALAEVNTRTERTGSQRNLDDANETRARMDERAGGNYFNLDFSDADVRRQYHADITRLEKLTGSQFSNEDKRTLRNVRDLVNLGGTAGERLTDAEAGIIDRTLNTFRKYLSNEIGGIEATSSYEAFRNVFRNALYGATVTGTETKTFEAAAGTLGQQLGPVLAQLQTQMTSLRNQLESIYQMNDEHLAYYYMGSDLEGVDRIIEALDERMDLMRTVAKTNGVQINLKTGETSLDNKPAQSGIVSPPTEATVSDEEADRRFDELWGE